MAPPEALAAKVPSSRPRPTLRRRLTSFLVSPKLAIALLVVVLGCCLVGVTVFRGTRAGEVIFATLWFNALLVLLAISSASAFFSRTWKRKLTVIQTGMILFHVSFLGVLGGVVYNSLFSFRGVMRITEGETLELGRAENYDEADVGRFFDPERLRGEATLVKMHANFELDGENKKAAYELEVRDGDEREHGLVYATQNLDFDGIRYFSLREGYSVLLVLSDGAGQETFGIHVPLQSIKQPGGTYLYSTGTASEPAAFPFPPPPEHPVMELEVAYYPGLVERTGDVHLAVRPFGPGDVLGDERKGLVPVGGEFDAGGLRISPREIRYWVGLNVRYDPGLGLILTSLCTGLAGMVLTLVGRVRQGTPRKRTACAVPDEMPATAAGAGGDTR